MSSAGRPMNGTKPSVEVHIDEIVLDGEHDVAAVLARELVPHLVRAGVSKRGEAEPADRIAEAIAAEVKR